MPYSAVGPFQTTSQTSPTDNSMSTPSLIRSLTSSNAITSNNTNSFFPIGNVFDIDPYDSDRLITCGPTNPRFYRLSIADEDNKLPLPLLTNSYLQNTDKCFPCSCVHWNKEKDMCMTTNTNGVIQLYKRINKPDV